MMNRTWWMVVFVAALASACSLQPARPCAGTSTSINVHGIHPAEVDGHG